MVISRDLTIKELIFTFPASTSYFMKHKVKLLVSGDARWGTLEEVLVKKNFNDEDINRMVDELNALYKERTGQ